MTTISTTMKKKKVKNADKTNALNVKKMVCSLSFMLTLKAWRSMWVRDVELTICGARAYNVRQHLNKSNQYYILLACSFHRLWLQPLSLLLLLLNENASCHALIQLHIHFECMFSFLLCAIFVFLLLLSIHMHQVSNMYRMLLRVLTVPFFQSIKHLCKARTWTHVYEEPEKGNKYDTHSFTYWTHNIILVTLSSYVASSLASIEHRGQLMYLKKQQQQQQQ